MSHAFQSAIKDNQGRSRVGDFLKENRRRSSATLNAI